MMSMTTLAPTSARPLGGSREEFAGDGVHVTVRAYPSEVWTVDEAQRFDLLGQGHYLAAARESDGTTTYMVVIDSYDLRHEDIERAIKILNERFNEGLHIDWNGDPNKVKHRVQGGCGG